MFLEILKFEVLKFAASIIFASIVLGVWLFISSRKKKK